jgi:hypothetical protein
VQFNRNSNGGWNQYDITGAKNLDQAQAITEPFTDTSDNDTSVMAINSASHLVQFNRDTNGVWNEYDITSTRSLDQVKAITNPFTDTSDNELSDIAVNSSSDLVQFNRNSGVWNEYNITSTRSLDHVTAISQPFTDSSNGDLSVMGINPSGDLVQFNRNSSGSWSQYDITSQRTLDQVKAITVPFTDTSNNDLSMVAINTAGDLVQFNRNSSGVWNEYNVTTKRSLDLVQAITEPFNDTLTGDLSVMASGTGNSHDLVQFNRNSSGVWNQYDVSSTNNLDLVQAITEPFNDTYDNDLSVMTIQQ